MEQKILSQLMVNAMELYTELEKSEEEVVTITKDFLHQLTRGYICLFEADLEHNLIKQGYCIGNNTLH